MKLSDLKFTEKVFEFKANDKILEILYSSPTVLDMERIYELCQKQWNEGILPSIRKQVPKVIEQVNAISIEDIKKNIIQIEMAIIDVNKDLMEIKDGDKISDQDKKAVIQKGLNDLRNKRQTELDKWTEEEARKFFLILYLRTIAYQTYQEAMAIIFLCNLCKDPETKESLFDLDDKSDKYYKKLDAQLYNQIFDQIVPLFQMPLDEEIRRIAETPDFLFYTALPESIGNTPSPMA